MTTNLSEFQLIEKYFSKLSCQRQDVVLGIGDDAAIVAIPRNQNLVLTMDTLNEGIHFPKNTAPADIGYKALAVNLSDLAAMGADPAWITLSISIPKAQKDWLTKFCHGLNLLLTKYSIQLIGGDLTHGPLTITIQAHGFIPKNQAMHRDGAKPGDLIYVSGLLGGAALALKNIFKDVKLSKKDFASVLPKLNRPEPRIALGTALRKYATSCIDISDGLAADLGHILEKSKVGATIYLDKLPLYPKLTSLLTPKVAYKLALTGGDDYELCFTIPPHFEKKINELSKKLLIPLTQIGVIDSKAGLRIYDTKGKTFPLKHFGYRHF